MAQKPLTPELVRKIVREDDGMRGIPRRLLTGRLLSTPLDFLVMTLPPRANLRLREPQGVRR